MPSEVPERLSARRSFSHHSAQSSAEVSAERLCARTDSIFLPVLVIITRPFFVCRRLGVVQRSGVVIAISRFAADISGSEDISA